MATHRDPIYCPLCNAQIKELHKETRGTETLFCGDTFIGWEKHVCSNGEMEMLKKILTEDVPAEMNRFLQEKGSDIKVEAQLITPDDHTVESDVANNIILAMMDNEEAESCIDHDSKFMIGTVRKTEKHILQQVIPEIMRLIKENKELKAKK